MDPWELMYEHTRTARKTHRCDECCSQIRPGERYRYVWGICDGEPSSIKTCLACVEAEKWYIDECQHQSDAWWWVGDLDQTILEMARDIKSFAGYRHVVGIRRRRRAARKYGSSAST